MEERLARGESGQSLVQDALKTFVGNPPQLNVANLPLWDARCAVHGNLAEQVLRHCSGITQLPFQPIAHNHAVCLPHVCRPGLLRALLGTLYAPWRRRLHHLPPSCLITNLLCARPGPARPPGLHRCCITTPDPSVCIATLRVSELTQLESTSGSAPATLDLVRATYSTAATLEAVHAYAAQAFAQLPPPFLHVRPPALSAHTGAPALWPEAHHTRRQPLCAHRCRYSTGTKSTAQSPAACHSDKHAWFYDSVNLELHCLCKDDL